MAMSETSDQLAFVSIDGRPLPHSHAELIGAPWGWQIELHDVPPGSCPLVRQVAEITLATQNGGRCAGTVIADLVSEDDGFVLLSGIGHLRLIASADAA
jgi:hypothetical protein